MRFDAQIEVMCPECGESEIVPLTATACRGWDERDVDAHLRALGWESDGDEQLCPDCKVKA